jgi:hypothetical protein
MGVDGARRCTEHRPRRFRVEWQPLRIHLERTAGAVAGPSRRPRGDGVDGAHRPRALSRESRRGYTRLAFRSKMRPLSPSLSGSASIYGACRRSGGQSPGRCRARPRSSPIRTECCRGRRRAPAGRSPAGGRRRYRRIRYASRVPPAADASACPTDRDNAPNDRGPRRRTVRNHESECREFAKQVALDELHESGRVRIDVVRSGGSGSSDCTMQTRGPWPARRAPPSSRRAGTSTGR